MIEDHNLEPEENRLLSQESDAVELQPSQASTPRKLLADAEAFGVDKEEEEEEKSPPGTQSKNREVDGEVGGEND